MAKLSNIELSILRTIANRLPESRVSAIIINRVIKRLYLRKRRDPVTVHTSFGLRIRVNPAEAVDAILLFASQQYEFRERKMALAVLKPGDVFIDAGAHIGWFSLLVASQVPDVRVVSLEPDNETFRRLTDNIALNQISNIQALNLGLAPTEGELPLYINDSGNLSGNSFYKVRPKFKLAAVAPLTAVLQRTEIRRVKLLKLDIEGGEYEVLSGFFRDAPTELYPEHILVEDLSGKGAGDKSISALITKYGYRETGRTLTNKFFSRSVIG